jgi:hypothetical protein
MGQGDIEVKRTTGDKEGKEEDGVGRRIRKSNRGNAYDQSTLAAWMKMS